MANEKIRGIGFHHIGLKTADLEKSVKFYEALGMKEIVRWGEGEKEIVMLDIGDGGRFELFAGGGDAFSENGKFIHFAMKVEDVPAAYAHALSVGAEGVISVLSNLFPADMMNAYRLFASGKNAAAALILRHLHKTARLLFSETNPAPVKAALSILGLIENELRLPMSPVSDALYEKIAEELSTLGAR